MKVGGVASTFNMSSLDCQRDGVNDVVGVDLPSRFLYVPFDGAGLPIGNVKLIVGKLSFAWGNSVVR